MFQQVLIPFSDFPMVRSMIVMNSVKKLFNRYKSRDSKGTYMMAELRKNVAPNVMKSVKKRKRIGVDFDVEAAFASTVFGDELRSKCDFDMS